MAKSRSSSRPIVPDITRSKLATIKCVPDDDPIQNHGVFGYVNNHLNQSIIIDYDNEKYFLTNF